MAADESAILVALGANLPGPAGPPRATLEAALATLDREGVAVLRRSRFWRTRPVPDDGQPWYVNAVVSVTTTLEPEALLSRLLWIEAESGRVRTQPNAPRILDLDLIAYGRTVRNGPIPPLLPHPRLAGRAFVLRPLAEVAPAWVHPVTGESVATLIARLPPDQDATPEA